MIYKMKKSIIPTILAGSFMMLSSCSTLRHNSVTEPAKSIVILYENDVHCNIDGYTKIAGLRDAINKSDTAYAAAVCVGDFLQGGTSGAVSRGQYVVDIMRNVGYSAVTLGNHEFDYGVPRMKELLSQLKSPVVCANFFDAGAAKPYYPPYVIQRIGNKRIAFVGAVTPETMLLESYAFHDDNGKVIYDLKPETFYPLVQQAVDDARREGADYVVLISHVGEETQSMGFDSHRLIAATKGIDVVLDGHSHNTIPHDTENNLNGTAIGITQTGTQFANIGKLLITKDGRLQTLLIPASDVPYENAQVTASTDSIKRLMNQLVNRTVCTSDYDLIVTDEAGQMLVRKAETNAGDLVADAYRNDLGTDIAFENGGGIRNDVKAGTITYGAIAALSPYDQHLVKLEVPGARIVDMLQKCTAITPDFDGNFPQCSGICYTIHTASHTVSDVKVLNADTGQYADIDPNRKYTVAVTTYYKGGGFYDALKGSKVLKEGTDLCRDIIANYLEKVLEGRTGSTYVQPQGRITIVND
jgi:2',3'-cyclic-nucleotide 2'-phosphodiesterase (5'-nucleotidase family)